jgi:hypothetical protein
MLMCVFIHSHFVENLPIGFWETNPCFFRGVLSHLASDEITTHGYRALTFTKRTTIMIVVLMITSSL